jgi:glycosyltransferase involved in cell wall biosynthesis
VRVKAAAEKRLRASSEFDLIYSMSFWANASEVAAALGIHYQIPYVIHDHRTQYQRALEYKFRISSTLIYAMEKAKVVLALTETHKENIAKFIKKEKIEIFSLPLRDDFFEVYYRNNETSDLILGAATNWREIKRLDVLLKAFDLALKENERMKLYVAGPIPGERKVLAKHKRVVLMGELNRTELKAFVGKLDILIISSDHETLGLPAIEALAVGTPVITTRCGGPEEIIDNANRAGEFVGCTVERGDPQALKYAILKLSKLSVDRSRIANYAKKEFSIESAQKKLEYIFKKISGSCFIMKKNDNQ